MKSKNTATLTSVDFSQFAQALRRIRLNVFVEFLWKMAFFIIPQAILYFSDKLLSDWLLGIMLTIIFGVLLFQLLTSRRSYSIFDYAINGRYAELYMVGGRQRLRAILRVYSN